MADAQLCALVSKNSGESPIGSASRYERLLLLELPPPWPRNALQAPQLPPDVRDVLAQVDRSGEPCSVLTVAPDPDYSRPGAVRLLYFQRPAGLFAHFERLELSVPAAELAASLTALLLKRNLLERNLGEMLRPYLQDTAHLRDLLVCTHENRDVCCGLFGEAAFRALRYEHARPDVRVWRTSHIGGHKFAPTLIDLPSGRFWGHLEPRAYAGLMDNTLELTELRTFYRGWSGVGKLEQVAERAVFEREGWSWAGARKAARIVASAPDRDEVTVALEFHREDGTSGRYRAVVACSGSAETLASSGTAPRVSVKQYEVTRLELETLQDSKITALGSRLQGHGSKAGLKT